MNSEIDLEPAAQAFLKALTVSGDLLHPRSPAAARAQLAQVQVLGGDLEMAPAEVEPHTIPGGPSHEISITVVRPENANGSLAAIIYLHGGGWVRGDFGTHQRLVRELAVGTGAAIVFVHYTRSPEACYPIAVEEAYAATAWVAKRGAELGLDGTRLAIAGDGAGGNLAAAVTLLASERGGPRIHYQVLFYPVTSADFATGSDAALAGNPWLSQADVAWCWIQYAPEPVARTEPTASPLLASSEQMCGLPPGLIITAEADVLRDEGEAYGRKLRDAGAAVTVIRYPGIIHDFVMLNPLTTTNAARAAVGRATEELKAALAGR